MKKIVGLIGIATVLFMLQLSVLAGDIITPLLSEDSAQVYFGKIKNVTDESVTVIQNKNIKGEFERDREYTYERLDSITREPIKTGDIYLCTVYEPGNYLMIWKTTSTNTETLKVISDHTFAYDLQQALNNGLFEKAEKKRLSRENGNLSDVSGANTEQKKVRYSIVVKYVSLFALILIVLLAVKNSSRFDRRYRK